MLKLKKVTEIHVGDKLARSGDLSHCLEISEVQEIHIVGGVFYEIIINDIRNLAKADAVLVVWED